MAHFETTPPRAATTDQPPEWAIEKARSEIDRVCGAHKGWAAQNVVIGAIAAFARYIAEHEQPPVDPLLSVARKIVSTHFNLEGQYSAAEQAKQGQLDSGPFVNTVLNAIRRGVEIGKAEGAELRAHDKYVRDAEI